MFLRNDYFLPKKPFVVSNDYKGRERILRKGSILDLNPILIRHKSQERKKPMKISKVMKYGKTYMNTKLDKFLDSEDKEQLDALKNYNYYNSIIRKQFLYTTLN